MSSDKMRIFCPIPKASRRDKWAVWAYLTSAVMAVLVVVACVWRG